MNLESTQMPCLTTAVTGPLLQLERYFSQHQVKIESWFRQQWRKTPPFLYCSVDLRNAGFKLTPVDTNLFPAGFNNLNSEFMPLYIQAAQSALDYAFPGCSRILLIPENHTRNTFYLENVVSLQQILIKSGFEVRIGSLLEELKTAQDFELPSGNRLRLEPLIRTGNRLGVKDFSACLVLLNNDLSEGVPEILQGLEQPITPPIHLGWSTRLKSTHFTCYEAVANEFAALLGIDPWLINPAFSKCGGVNFSKHEGEDCLVQHIEKILTGIQRKYQEYGIKEEPFVVVKADAGTYGMGVISVRSPDEIRHLNRKDRKRMSMTKGHKEITQVIIQEGIYTFEAWGEQQAAAEPVVYLLGKHVIGGFYRVHTERSTSENLNAPGAQFEPLAFVECCNNPDYGAQPREYANRLYVYGVVARLASIAAAREGIA